MKGLRTLFVAVTVVAVLAFGTIRSEAITKVSASVISSFFPAAGMLEVRADGSFDPTLDDGRCPAGTFGFDVMINVGASEINQKAEARTVIKNELLSRCGVVVNENEIVLW